MPVKSYYLYILTNQRKTVLYTGVTNDLEQRIPEHWPNRGIKTHLRESTTLFTYYSTKSIFTLMMLLHEQKKLKAGTKVRK